MIRFEDVVKSYNGKTGCMCGCLGTYALSSNTSIAQANKLTGYEAYDENSVNDRKVKIAIKKINEAIESGDKSASFDPEWGIGHFDTGTRNTVIYTKAYFSRLEKTAKK